MIVRKATFEDIPKLVQWGERFHAMSFFSKLSFFTERNEELFNHDDSFTLMYCFDA